jgi:hypothetical protein
MTRHLVLDRILERAGFGALPGETERLGQGPGLREPAEDAPALWLDRQLERPAPEPRSDAISEHISSGIGPLEPWSRDPDMRRELRRRARETARRLAGDRIVRAAGSPDRLREVMIDFWSNHFAVDARAGAVVDSRHDRVRPYCETQRQCGQRPRAR